MNTELRGYAALIADAIGSTDPALLALVGEFMRVNGGPLDGLSARQFAARARQSLADAATRRADGAIDGHGGCPGSRGF